MKICNLGIPEDLDERFTEESTLIRFDNYISVYNNKYSIYNIYLYNIYLLYILILYMYIYIYIYIVILYMYIYIYSNVPVTTIENEKNINHSFLSFNLHKTLCYFYSIYSVENLRHNLC